MTGFSGTGKSSVGKTVAQRLGWEFVDTDQEIAQRAGKPICCQLAFGYGRFSAESIFP